MFVVGAVPNAQARQCSNASLEGAYGFFSALYEQGKVHHIGTFSQLQDQMCAFTTDFDRVATRPDRLDALVWGLTWRRASPIKPAGADRWGWRADHAPSFCQMTPLRR
jgi:hypothetical protein